MSGSDHDDVVERLRNCVGTDLEDAAYADADLITRLRLSLKEKDEEIEKLRDSVIEECAKVAENYAKEALNVTGVFPSGERNAALSIAGFIRSLSRGGIMRMTNVIEPMKRLDPFDSVLIELEVAFQHEADIRATGEAAAKCLDIMKNAYEVLKSSRAETIEQCAKISEGIWLDANDTEWDDGVNCAKRAIAKAIRTLSKVKP